MATWGAKLANTIESKIQTEANKLCLEWLLAIKDNAEHGNSQTSVPISTPHWRIIRAIAKWMDDNGIHMSMKEYKTGRYMIYFTILTQDHKNLLLAKDVVESLKVSDDMAFTRFQDIKSKMSLEGIIAAAKDKRCPFQICQSWKELLAVSGDFIIPIEMFNKT